MLSDLNVVTHPDHPTLASLSAEHRPLPVQKITISDLFAALSAGLDDFWAKPSHIVFLGIIYPIIGVFLGRLVVGNEILPLLFPLAAGFALIGPFAAVGLYEISRRRELGLDSSFRHAFDVVRAPSFGSIATLGVLMLVIFVSWLVTAMGIYDLTFAGKMPNSMLGFISEVFTTPHGWALIMLGGGAGFIFAVVSLTISVISFPLLLDRNVGVVVAVRTSIQAVLKNPIQMAVWGLIVAAELIAGSLPFFVGLAVIMPVLGHSTWHLYRRIVAR